MLIINSLTYLNRRDWLFPRKGLPRATTNKKITFMNRMWLRKWHNRKILYLVETFVIIIVLISPVKFKWLKRFLGLLYGNWLKPYSVLWTKLCNWITMFKRVKCKFQILCHGQTQQRHEGLCFVFICIHKIKLNVRILNTK